MITTSYCIEHAHLNSSTHQYKRTLCSSRVNVNTKPFHTFHEHKHIAAITIVVYLYSTSGWYYDLIPYWIPSQDRTHTNVPSVCPGPTQHRWIKSIHMIHTTTVITIVSNLDITTSGWDCDLIVHMYRTWIRVSNSNTHQYKRTFCSSRSNMIPVNTFNDKHTPDITIVVYLDNTSGWDYDFVLHRTWVTHSNSNTHTNINTHPVHPRSTRRRSIRSTNINVQPPSPVYSSVFGQHIGVRLRPHTHRYQSVLDKVFNFIN